MVRKARLIRSIGFLRGFCDAIVRGDLFQVKGTCSAIDQGDTIEEESCGKSAQKKILQCRLPRTSRSSRSHPRQNIDGDRHRLKSEENGNEMGTCRHQHHPDRGKEDQCIIFSEFNPFPLGKSNRKSEQSKKQMIRKMILKKRA